MSRVGRRRSLGGSRAIGMKDEAKELKGDPSAKYANGQIVWAKFGSFPWWPGKVLLTKEDKGQDRIRIEWFGDAGDESNTCTRTNIIAFDPALEAQIKEDVEKCDLALFTQCVADAFEQSTQLNDKGKKNDGSANATSSPMRPRRRSLMRSTVSNGGEEKKTTAEEEKATPNQRRSRRRSSVLRPSVPHTMDVVSTSSPSTSSPSKKVRFSAEKIEINQPGNTEDETTKSSTLKGSPASKDKTPEGRRRSARLLDDVTGKRKRCLQMTMRTHEADDLSVFIAHQYYSYLEDGKTHLDALTLVAQKWEMKQDSVLEHLDACEFESGKPPNKRTRIGA